MQYVPWLALEILTDARQSRKARAAYIAGQIEELGDDAERARHGVFLAFGSVAENHGAHYSLLDTEERDGKVGTWCGSNLADLTPSAEPTFP